MVGVQGLTHCHWTPPSVEHLHNIAPADKIVAYIKKNDEKATYLSVVLLAVAVPQYDTKASPNGRGPWL